MSNILYKIQFTMINREDSLNFSSGGPHFHDGS